MFGGNDRLIVWFKDNQHRQWITTHQGMVKNTVNTRKLTTFLSACTQPTATVTENTNNLPERQYLKRSVYQSASPSYEDNTANRFMRNRQLCCVDAQQAAGLNPAEHYSGWFFPGSPERRKWSIRSACVVIDCKKNLQPLRSAIPKWHKYCGAAFPVNINAINTVNWKWSAVHGDRLDVND